MQLTTERNRNIISGAVGLLVLFALITVGIKASFGAFDGGYELRGTFAAAGQGLLSGSDVKIRGVNVGEVSSIDLVENRAVIRLRIEDGTRIPATAQAVIRPKTLFGEKFVDILLGEDETTGPYLGDGDVIEDTLGGFELEQVLSDAFPVLEAVDPAELAVVLDELATAGDGLGEQINRSIVNSAVLTDLGVSNDAEFRQFTSDLALLTEELDRVAPAIVAGARDLNRALPTLNERGDRLNTALVQAGRLAGDLADLLDANRGFITAANTTGAETLQLVFDERANLQPLLVGTTGYARTIAEAIRFEVGDGTMMAAVKNLVSTNAVDGVLADDVPAGQADPGGLADDLPVDVTVPPEVADAADAVLGGSQTLLDLLAGGDR